MQPHIPQFIEVLFILLTFFLLAVTVLAVRIISGDRKTTVKTFIILFLWLSFLKIISGMSFFHDFESMPPRLIIGPLSCIIAITVLAFSRSFGGFLKRVPLHWLVYVQGFRIVMEIILCLLAENGVIHERMTFTGLNFDILAGISALLVGWLVKKNKISRAGLIAWNIACVILLLNIVGIAALSTPYPFAVFRDEPVNTAVFYFPFIWLPGFVAPFALAMHVFTIRKVMLEKKSA
jgi:hypothetical protein